MDRDAAAARPDPRHPATNATDAHDAPPMPTLPVRGLVFTLFRHGHGLTREESRRRLRESLRPGTDWPPQAA